MDLCIGELKLCPMEYEVRSFPFLLRNLYYKPVDPISQAILMLPGLSLLLLLFYF